jgi:ATP-binding cassette subfamily F protein 3
VVERFKAKASKAAMAQSIIKKLDKLDRIENVELERPNIRINFLIDKQPGRVLCSLKHVSKSFGDVNILEDTVAEIDRGDKVALIGANGKGKSTLLRIIAGTEPIKGERIWGHNVEESFYAQHQLEALNVNNDILEEMKESRSGKTDLELRSLLGCFLFSGDDVEKKIKVLSGGEKARVALAKTIVSKANFLMLDEPTNHLDMHSVELLIEALNKYEGSIVLVSHDRYFISRIANKIWEIEDHKIVEFKGSYAEWEEWKQRREATRSALAKANDTAKPQPEKIQPKEEPRRPEPAINAPIDKELKKEHQRLKSKFGQCEERLAKLNTKKVKLEADMADPAIYADKVKFQETEKSYQQLTQELQQANKEYEDLFEKLMEAEDKLG